MLSAEREVLEGEPPGPSLVRRQTLLTELPKTEAGGDGDETKLFFDVCQGVELRRGEWKAQRAAGQSMRNHVPRCRGNCGGHVRLLRFRVDE